MAKSNRAKKKQQLSKPTVKTKTASTEDLAEILHDMIVCSSSCSGDGYVPKEVFKMDPLRYLEYLDKNLPSLKYVQFRIADYIFSNGFTTGNRELDERLDKWMYKQNIKGDTNYNVLRSAVISSMSFGQCGVRWLSEEDGIVNIYTAEYGEITRESDKYKGVRVPFAYLVSTDGARVDDINIDKLDFDMDAFWDFGYVQTTDSKFVLLSSDEFLNLKWQPSDVNGDSPLLYDRQRVNLISTVYVQLNDDLTNDSPGRLILHVDINPGDAFGNSESTSKALSTSGKVRESIARQAYEEVTEVAEQIKNSGKRNVFALSSAFKDKVTHLPKTTKATEFFNYISDEGIIICQLYGVAPALLELGRVFGNVSMSKIIDNAIMNSIIPLRERIATQFSNFLAPKLGFDKIYFNKYDLEQIADEAEHQKTVAQIMEILVEIGYSDLAEEFARQMQADLEEDNDPKTNSAKNNKLSVSINPLMKLYDIMLQKGMVKGLAA